MSVQDRICFNWRYAHADVSTPYCQLVNSILWHDVVLYVILGVGTLLLVWTKFGPFVALTHGVAVIRGDFDDKSDPGAINHSKLFRQPFRQRSASATSPESPWRSLWGGPGAIFWMWVVGIVGMAIKMTERHPVHDLPEHERPRTTRTVDRCMSPAADWQRGTLRWRAWGAGLDMSSVSRYSFQPSRAATCSSLERGQRHGTEFWRSRTTHGPRSGRYHGGS